ncbi:MAG: 5-(carboxyamino)imidazole ribonucleotide mutase [Candidatus Thermoplasmatota archaeon]|nr:5-(carboxyamino)imidazole ribonucleotide mutase [Candidatus Thermoplasmatota archaeon]MBU1915295.1 5-(carboxyamino)imidazole ribonucleotide mutase [Candidatus Thermoplasmatota archaeon]
MSVQIVLGSKSDLKVAEKAVSILKELGVKYKVSIASAHRTPELVDKLVSEADAEVFIAIAGLSAALPGVIAARTLKPVIGVPVSGAVNLDSILSVVQMPPGIPVAGVGLDRGDNAALLAAEILALKDEKVMASLVKYRQKLKDNVLQDSKEVEI